MIVRADSSMRSMVAALLRSLRYRRGLSLLAGDRDRDGFYGLLDRVLRKRSPARKTVIETRDGVRVMVT
jgi:hypothetical protein